MQFVKKISAKIVASKSMTRMEGKGQKKLFDVVGIASGFLNGESQYGSWTAFIGQFQARSLEGEDYAAPQVFLPEPAQSMLIAALTSRDGAENGVEFAFEVGIREPTPGKPSVSGYEYYVRPLMDTRQDDRMAQLLARALPPPE